MIVPNLYALTQEHWIRTLVETTQDLTLTADYALEQQIGFKLRLANQRHLEIFNRRMPDITPTQFAVLAKLRDEARISQNHLGRLVGMDAATTKGVIDRLRKKGLVHSTPVSYTHLTLPTICSV